MSLPNLLNPRTARPLQPLPGGPAQGLALVRGRVHEFCGPARRTLAALVLERSDGPVVWVYPGWHPERLCPDGLAEFTNPRRLILCAARRPEDILWALEEALRSGAAPLVVGELPLIPALTPVRRLNLAAEAGAETAHNRRGQTPLGLLLTPGQGGAQGVESRWHMAHAPSRSTLIEQHSAWHLSRQRAREHPPARWQMGRDEEGQMQIDSLSPA